MMHPQGQRIDLFLQPGEYFVGNQHYVLRTLLGSCVSITLWNPARRVGAMSHFLLPTRGTAIPAELDGRYGDEAMLLMLSELAQLDIRPMDCRAKIFGGAEMFPGQHSMDSIHVGRKNGTAARDLLHAHRIEVVSEHLFGAGHRQVIFDIHTGDVWARQAKLTDTA